MTYLIFKEIPGIGTRYLERAAEPISWVSDPRKAAQFDGRGNEMDRWARALGAQTVEYDDGWNGPGSR